MLLPPDRPKTTFGWSVERGPTSNARFERTHAALRSAVQQRVEACFPPARGYLVRASTGTGPRTFAVQRGDFEAAVTVEGQNGVLRVYGEAASARLSLAMARTSARVAWARRVGGAAGVGLFAAMCWLVLGQYNPVFVLGGLLMAVALLVMSLAGSGSGAWLVDRWGDGRIKALRRAVVDDPCFRESTRRWQSLLRQLGPLRRALTKEGGLPPFRREPQGALAPATADTFEETG